MRRLFAFSVALVLAGTAFSDRVTAGPAADDLARAEAMIEVERFDRALAILKQVDVAGAEDAVRLDIALGRIFLGLGKASRALEFFEAASAKSLDDARALAGQAQCELALGRLRDAARDATSALRSDGASVSARLTLAQVAQRLGRRQEGDAMLAALVADMPDSEEAAVARARYLAEASRPQAVAQLDDFVRRHPYAAAAEDALGRLQWAAGKRDIGLDHRRRAADLFAEKGNTARAEAIHAWIAAAAALPVETKPLPPGKGGAQGQTLTPPLREARVQVPADPGRPAGRGANSFQPFPFQAEWEGSGLVLEGGQLVLTNHHVVEGGTKFAVRNGLGEMRVAKVRSIYRRADLALLELVEPLTGVDGFPLSQIVAPRVGRRIMVLGYPVSDLLGDDAPTLTEGTIAKETGFRDERETFQMTARIQHGNSGGPIFDRYGNLVGLSVSGLETERIFLKQGQHVASTWFGVNAGLIADFLQVPLVADPPSREEVDPEEFYQQQLGQIVMVAGKK